MAQRVGSKIDLLNTKIDNNPMHHIAIVTTPDMEVARELARIVLEKRLAACANLLSGLESHYWWEEELCCEKEILLILKTTTENIPKLEAHVLKAHPYDTPEFVSWIIDSGSKKYLDWISSNTAIGE